MTTRNLVRECVTMVYNVENEADNLLSAYPNSYQVENHVNTIKSLKVNMVRLRNQTIEVINEYQALVRKYEIELTKLKENA